MNYFGLRAPKGRHKDGWNRDRALRDAFQANLAALRASDGSQAVIRARRKAKVEPPQYADPREKEKRRLKNRARKLRQRMACR